MTFYFPPAKTSFNWFSVILNSIVSRKYFTHQLRSYLSAQQVVVGDSWVPLLAAGLKSLQSDLVRRKIIVPGYCCNEFIKAILLAGLEPYYVDINDRGEMEVSSFESIDPSEILAILVVNTSGVVSDHNSIRAWCEKNNCWLVEDAGYTILGQDENGAPFGSLGHVAIINMSEGKIFPCGGAAWVINDQRLIGSCNLLEESISSQSPRSIFSEAIQLLVYKVGSSKWGFHLYQLLRKFGLSDLKQKFSSEPSRYKENYLTGDLEWENGSIRLTSQHRKELEKIRIRPWNRIRNQCAITILEQYVTMRSKRLKKLTLFNKYLSSVLLSLPKNGMPIKLPILLSESTVAASDFSILLKRGLKKQYPPTWPMTKLPLPNSIRFYHQSYTLPIHDSIDNECIRKISTHLLKLLDHPKNTP
ncbi:MAG: hypothetical protein RIT05_819 [Bacteroidota bacterium]|jgi:dTDP-4-amino-4,6-dideoxygalactose transaminase